MVLPAWGGAGERRSGEGIGPSAPIISPLPFSWHPPHSGEREGREKTVQTGRVEDGVLLLLSAPDPRAEATPNFSTIFFQRDLSAWQHERIGCGELRTGGLIDEGWGWYIVVGTTT